MDDKGKVKLGRPWVTTALDHYTRMPVGLVVHFLDQSVSAVFLCLRNMMMPKDFLRKLVPEIDYDYPFGVPVLPFMDRGPDWDTENVRFVLGTFGMVPQYEPVGCPNFKGAIERWQRTTQEEVDHTLPGATPPWSTDGYVWDEDGEGIHHAQRLCAPGLAVGVHGLCEGMAPGHPGRAPQPLEGVRRPEDAARVAQEGRP